MKWRFSKDLYQAHRNSVALQNADEIDGEEVRFDEFGVPIAKIHGVYVDKEWCEPVKESAQDTYDTQVMFTKLCKHPYRQYKRVSDGLIMKIKDGKYHWEPNHRPLAPDDRWVEAPQEKEVPFMEAVKARHNGNTVVCKWYGDENIYAGGQGPMKDQNGLAVSSDEILNDHWFIK